MARTGRKAKTGKRQPDGRLKPPTLAELKERDYAARMAETQTVLAQPHRMGNPDPRMGCEFGRFTVAAKLSMDIYNAGEIYRKILRSWRSEMHVPTVERLSEGIGGGEGASPETVKGWAMQIDAAYRAMFWASREGVRHATNLIGNHTPVPAFGVEACKLALIALAREMGQGKRPRHRPVDVG